MSSIDIKRRNIIAFSHIEKCAGTTLKEIFRANYGVAYSEVRPLIKNSTSARSSRRFTAEDLKIILRINPFVRCIAGHSVKASYDMVKSYPNLTFITLLRDPVDRCISRHIYRRDILGIEKSFETHLANPDFWNSQCNKITPNGMLDEAKERLHNLFGLVGLTERFDVFLLLLKQMIKDDNFNLSYQKKNVTLKNSDEINDFKIKHLDRIKELNYLDVCLYDYAKNIIIPKYEQQYVGDLKGDLVKLRTIKKRPMSKKCNRYVAALYNRLYYGPITGIVRVANGLEWHGIY